MTDRIETSIELQAPIERVWRALTNHEEFGEWFRVKLAGPFVVDQVTTGEMTYPGAEGLAWRSTTTRIDEERHAFAFTWTHPVDPLLPQPDDPSTLVEFQLEAIPGGTRLMVSESGFDSLPAERRTTIMRENAQGWEIQTGNIKAYVER